MFRAWQIVVAATATVYMLYAISSGTPWIVAVPAALLIMSVLAADA